MVDIWTIILCTVILGLYVLYKKTSRDPKLPPGPPTVPFLGNLTSLNPENILQNFQEYRRRYGDVFSLILGARTTVVVNGYDTIKDIFVKYADIVSDRPDTFFTEKILQKKGFLGSSGSLWKEHRSFALMALREFGFGKKSLESKIIEEVEAFMNLIEEKKSQPFDIKPALSSCVSNVMCSINFGKRFEHNDPYFVEMNARMDQNLSNTNILMGATFFPFIEHIPFDPFRLQQALKNIDAVDKHLLKVVEEHEATFDENNMRDYTDMYIRNMRQQKDNPESTFDPGTETTTTAMRWLIVLLINNPEVQDKMRKEIEDIVGASRYPSLEDKPNMLYTEVVLHEVLRFGSILPMTTPFAVKEDLQYRGNVIPKDCILLMNIHSVLYDPDIFENPDSFNPSRFIENGKLANVEKNITFSVGRRNCIGESLAKMEFFLFATTLVQRFRLLPAEENCLPSTKHKLGITCGPCPFLFRAVTI